jgi:hypothetical protein
MKNAISASLTYFNRYHHSPVLRSNFVLKRSYYGNEFIDKQCHANTGRTDCVDVHNYWSFFRTGIVKKIPLPAAKLESCPCNLFQGLPDSELRLSDKSFCVVTTQLRIFRSLVGIIGRQGAKFLLGRSYYLPYQKQ